MPDASGSLLGKLGGEVAAGRLIPFLGPDLLGLNGPPVVPAGARELANLLSAKTAVPGRLRNNLWHAAQYIESNRHRVTLDRLMAVLFAPVPAPGPLHLWLAGLTRLPLVVDTWYDGTMRAALTASGRTDWGQVQGASKARRLDGGIWTRTVDRAGAIVDDQVAADWATVLYKPHGAAQPTGDVLVSDSDYVEVLTEIDIQTPIPEAVRERRSGRGFLFLGCRFYDQILRTFVRQICKRSGGRRYAVVPDGLTPNEIRFLAAEGIEPLVMPLNEAISILTH